MSLCGKGYYIRNYTAHEGIIIHTRNVAVRGLNRFRLRCGKRHDRNSGLAIDLLTDLLPGEINSF